MDKVLELRSNFIKFFLLYSHFNNCVIEYELINRVSLIIIDVTNIRNIIVAKVDFKKFKHLFSFTYSI